MSSEAAVAEPEAETVETSESQAPSKGLAAKIMETYRAESETEGQETPEETAPVKEAKPEKKTASKKEVKAAKLEDFLGESEETEEEAEVAAKSESEASDEEEAPESVKEQGEKAVARWGELRKKEKEFDKIAKERDELQAKLEANPAANVEKEVEELRRALAEKDRVIATYSVEESDEFINAVQRPLGMLEEQARSLAADEDEEEAIISALADPNIKSRNKKLAELTEGMSSFSSAKLVRLVDEVDAVLARGDEIRRNALVAKEEIERNKLARTAQESEKDKQARAAASETVWKNIVKQLPFLVDEEGELLPEYKDIREKGKVGITPDMKLETQAFGGYAARLVPHMAGLIAEREAKIAELEGSLKALRGASPTVGNGSAAPSNNGPRVPLAKSIMAAIKADMGG